MPRVTLTRRQADHERWRENLNHLKSGRTDVEMAKIIGAKRGPTFRDRLNHPGKLTLDELSMLCEKFKHDRAKFICGLLNEGEGFR